MDLKSLKYFVAACEAGSITGAAEACHIAQPSITLAIHKLESELDTRLLDRSKKGVSPTSEGQELYIRARKLLAQSRALVDHFKDKTPRPVLRVHLGITLSLSRMQDVLQRLQPLQQQYQLQITQEKNECAIFVTHRESIPAGFAYQQLWKDEYCLLLPLSHPLTDKDALAIEDLLNLVIIERSFCELSELWHQFLAERKISPIIAAQCDSEEWAWAMVAAGIGVCIGPGPSPDTPWHQQIKSIPLSRIKGLPEISREVGIGIHQALSSAVDVLSPTAC